MKKTDLTEFLLDIYKVTASNDHAFGAQKMQLFTTSIFGVTLLVTFTALIYSLLNKDGFLGRFSILSVVTFIGLIVLAMFILFIRYFLFLHKIQRTHAITAFAIEVLLQDAIWGGKEEDEIENEIKKLFPYSRFVDMLKLKEKKLTTRWVHKLFKKQGMEYLLERGKEK